MQVIRHNPILATWLPVIGGAMLAVFGESQIQLAGLLVWGAGVCLQVTLGAYYLLPRIRRALVGRVLLSNVNGVSEDHANSLDEARLLQAFRQAEPLLQRVILEGLHAAAAKDGDGFGTAA